jgi:hypothetical protein
MILRSLAELNRKNDRNGKPTLAARIAIAAGEIFGELPKVAARAQAVSEPSTEMIATQQRQIPGPLVTEERGSPELKSVPRALRANGIVPARGNGSTPTNGAVKSELTSTPLPSQSLNGVVKLPTSSAMASLHCSAIPWRMKAICNARRMRHS